MKLRLTQPGWESYSGQMGVLFFENGLSTADVRPLDAKRMAAFMLCVWEDGTSPNVAQSILDNADTPAPVVNPDSEAEHDQQAEDGVPSAPVEPAVVVTPPVVDPAKPAAKVYTRDELAAIADKEGIKGLRAIAPEGVKNTSIVGLIDEILQHQAAHPQ